MMPYKDRNSEAAIASRKKSWDRQVELKGSEWNRDRQLRMKYGIGITEYEQMLDAQDGLCAVCGSEGNEKHRWEEAASLVVDHCHETGQVRGLLCPPCNRAIGQFHEDINIVEAALGYLVTAKEAASAAL